MTLDTKQAILYCKYNFYVHCETKKKNIHVIVFIPIFALLQWSEAESSISLTYAYI